MSSTMESEVSFSMRTWNLYRWCDAAPEMSSPSWSTWNILESSLWSFLCDVVSASLSDWERQSDSERLFLTDSNVFTLLGHFCSGSDLWLTANFRLLQDVLVESYRKTVRMVAGCSGFIGDSLCLVFSLATELWLSGRLLHLSQSPPLSNGMIIDESRGLLWLRI